MGKIQVINTGRMSGTITKKFVRERLEDIFSRIEGEELVLSAIIIAGPDYLLWNSMQGSDGIIHAALLEAIKGNAEIENGKPKFSEN